MKNFFKKLRQKSLSENKVVKYLTYSLGEIILLIIGILIALAINEKVRNNNNLKTRNLYIVQLIEEADQNLKKLNENKDLTRTILSELDTLAGIFKNQDFENPKLNSKLLKLLTFHTFIPAVVTLENLKFSGDLKLFDDLNIRNAIIETYSSFDLVKIVESIDYKFVDFFSQDYLFPNIRIMNIADSKNYLGKELLFENALFSRTGLLQQNMAEYDKTIGAITELKEALSELQKKK